MSQSFVYFSQLERIIFDTYSEEDDEIPYAELCLAMWQDMELNDGVQILKDFLPEVRSNSMRNPAWVYVGCSADGIKAHEWLQDSQNGPKLPIGVHITLDVIAIVGKYYDGSGDKTTFEYVFVREKLYEQAIESLRQHILRGA